MDPIVHIDLFSGLGGFAYAADQVWENVEHIFCEIDPYCQALLKKRFKRSVIYNDIRQFTANAERKRLFQCEHEKRPRQEKRIFEREDCGIDILTGGFPCQPFSQAGNRRGADDDRHLWPEMFRVIKEFRPAWIIGENVAGIISMAQYEDGPQMGCETDLFGNKTDTRSQTGRGILYGIIEQLGEIGYSVQTFIIPACAVNAPHRRDRVWIVAHSGCEHGKGTENRKESKRKILSKETTAMPKRPASHDGKGDASHSNNSGSRTPSNGINEKGQKKNKGRQEQPFNRIDGYSEDAPDTGNQRLQGDEQQRTPGERSGTSRPITESAWNENWLEVATELCRVDDGLSSKLDGFKLSKAKHRVERLKALGNSIVPQVAIEIMKAIKLELFI